MNWYTYKALITGETLVLCHHDDGSVTSGKPDSFPEYLAWVAEGNVAEEWQPE